MPYPTTAIVGTMKSGTTAIFHYLNAHPEVLGSFRKETVYFMDKTSSVFRPELNYHDHGIGRYAECFPPNKSKSNPKIVLESTPGFMYQETALKAFAIEPELADTQIIFMLREPVSKLQSLYNYFCFTRLEIPQDTTFVEFVKMVKSNDDILQKNEFLKNAIQHGQYIDYIQRWIEACGRDRISVFLYEDFNDNNTEFMKMLCKHIDIDSSFFDDFVFKKKNPTLYIKNTKFHQFIGSFKRMIPQSNFRDKIRDLYRSRNFSKENTSVSVSNDEENVLNELRKYYAPYNEQLAESFNLDLSKWQVIETIN